MVFKRSLKTDIKKLIKNICIIVVFFTTVSVFVFNTVFAASDLHIPVEIVWNDSDASTRPSQIILHVRRTGTTTDLKTVTLTSADVDPNDSNKWTTLITGITYNSSYTYEIVQDTVQDYNTTESASVSVSTKKGIISYGTDSFKANGHTTKEYDDSNFVLVRKNSTVFWAYDCANTPAFQNVYNELSELIGGNFVVNTCEYSSPYSSNEVDITYDSGSDRITIATNQGGNFTVYYGFIDNTPVGDKISLTNTYGAATTYDVVYQFTGSAQPANAGSLLPATVSYEAGDTVTVASEPTATGYRFLGWQRNGSPISGTFTMPADNVTITGSWEQFNGYFTPDISVVIPNKPDYYRVSDIVPFEITITNTANYPITDVHVAELMSDATFIAGTGYTLSSAQEAVIASIPANSSIKLYAQYEVIMDLTASYLNNFEITSASADNYYYLDETEEYIAADIFNVRGWQDDPVVTGVNSSGTTFYSYLTLMGALGIGTIVVIKYRKKLKERER